MRAHTPNQTLSKQTTSVTACLQRNPAAGHRHPRPVGLSAWLASCVPPGKKHPAPPERFSNRRISHIAAARKHDSTSLPGFPGTCDAMFSCGFFFVDDAIPLGTNGVLQLAKYSWYRSPSRFPSSSLRRRRDVPSLKRRCGPTNSDLHTAFRDVFQRELGIKAACELASVRSRRFGVKNLKCGGEVGKQARSVATLGPFSPAFFCSKINSDGAQ
mmetsp:Transcript_6156/g.14965  ORF Transcript_6156/g.14965 Transcript_6156/m.14965 type:complete len:214 (-) Transcript_6156:58-699(-)